MYIFLSFYVSYCYEQSSRYEVGKNPFHIILIVYAKFAVFQS